MLDTIRELWAGLSAAEQDALVLVGLLAPTGILWAALRVGYAPGRLIHALLRRDIWVNLVFIALIAVSVGMSIGLIAQERALREGSARAADKFDLIISAPGSELTMLFAAVYLQPSAVPLLDGDVFNAVASHDRTEFAAPLAFGDSHRGAPIVGTTAAFADYLSGGQIEGRMFAEPFEAIVGPALPLQIGDRFIPAHGLGDAAEVGLHADQITIVGRFAVTGSPWDSAILTPVEGVWLAHAMGTGRADPDDTRLGPPYEPALFPGTPAIIVRAGDLAATYALQAEFNSRDDAMAFFPGTVLARLHNVMGDVRAAMTLMSTVTQMLVAISVLTGLFVLTRLNRPRLVLLRTLGAPSRFILVLVWSQAVLLLLIGTILGALLGLGAAEMLSRLVSEATGIAVTARIGWQEVHSAAAFLSIGSLLSLMLGLRAAWAAASDAPLT